MLKPKRKPAAQDRADKLARLCAASDNSAIGGIGGIDLQIEDMVREWIFADDIGRRWRFDLAWPSFRVAVEIDGFGPGHYSKHGRAKDNYKANAAALRG